jgi:hypothetical protein
MERKILLQNKTLSLFYQCFPMMSVSITVRMQQVCSISLRRTHSPFYPGYPDCDFGIAV